MCAMSTRDPAAPIRSGAGLRLSTVWVLAAVALPVTLAFGAMSSVDLAYAVRAGHVMLESGGVLRVDPFTFTAHCAPWVNQQWGGELLLAGAFDALGWLGLALARGVLVGALAGFLYAACRHTGAVSRAAAWATLVACLAMLGGLQLRAQLLGLVLFAALLWILEGREIHPQRLWWAVPVLLVWANVHGSFPLGVFLLFVTWLEDRRRAGGRSALGVLVLASLATFVTPFGARVWTYVVELSTDPTIREVVREWRPPSVGTYTGAAFFVSVGLAIVVLWRNRREPTWTRWVQLVVFLALAATSSRAVHWWVIVLAVTLSGLPWASRRPAVDVRNRANTVIGVAVAVVPLVTLVRWLPYEGDRPPPGLVAHAPSRLAAELRSVLEPGEPFANPQAWGSWFELELPGHPVSVDSRFEVLPDDVVRASLDLAEAAPGWERRLDALGVRVLVVDRSTEEPLVAALTSAEGWTKVYADADGLIYVREGRAPPAPLPPCDAAS